MANATFIDTPPAPDDTGGEFDATVVDIETARSPRNIGGFVLDPLDRIRTASAQFIANARFIGELAVKQSAAEARRILTDAWKVGHEVVHGKHDRLYVEAHKVPRVFTTEFGNELEVRVFNENCFGNGRPAIVWSNELIVPSGHGIAVNAVEDVFAIAREKEQALIVIESEKDLSKEQLERFNVEVMAASQHDVIDQLEAQFDEPVGDLIVMGRSRSVAAGLEFIAMTERRNHHVIKGIFQSPVGLVPITAKDDSMLALESLGQWLGGKELLGFSRWFMGLPIEERATLFFSLIGTASFPIGSLPAAAKIAYDISHGALMGIGSRMPDDVYLAIQAYEDDVISTPQLWWGEFFSHPDQLKDIRVDPGGHTAYMRDENLLFRDRHLLDVSPNFALAA